MAIAPHHAAETPERPPRPLIGYAGVPTEEQGTDPGIAWPSLPRSAWDLAGSVCGLYQEHLQA